jgi:cell division protein FtsW
MIKRVFNNSHAALFNVALLLFAIGLINVFSSSFVVANQQEENSFFYLQRHLRAFGVGMILFIPLLKIKYQNLRKYAWLSVFITICLLLLTYSLGLEVNGAKRWLNIGIGSFQPSELAKYAVILLTASTLSRNAEQKKQSTLLSGTIAVVAIIGVIVQKQPDMGTALVFVGLAGLLFLLNGIPLKEMMALGVVGIMSVTYLALAESYRAERVYAWLDPWEYPKTSGYQAIQSFMAIGSGGLWGVGLGRAASKYNWLPEAYTDFAYAVWCEEFGFIGAATVIILLVMFAFYGFRIAMNAPDYFGMLLAAGMTVLVAGQGLANIAMVSGVLPVKGLPLPFISVGGTSLMVNMMAVATLINIGKASRTQKIQNGSNVDQQRQIERLPKAAMMSATMFEPAFHRQD